MGKTRERYKAKNKMITSKAMAHMREVAFGHDTDIALYHLGVKQAARDDNAVMAAAEAKRQRKAAKALKQLETSGG